MLSGPSSHSTYEHMQQVTRKLSWSRLLYAKRTLDEQNWICPLAGEIFMMCDSVFDVVQKKKRFYVL